jgi:hypothetical protein
MLPRANPRRTCVRLDGVALVLLLAGCAAQPAPSPEPRMALAAVSGCTLPSSPPAPSAGFTEFANYSWQLFVAVNWPVTAGQRGVADCARPLGAPGPTVWESFKTVDQTFLAGAADPGPWSSPGAATLRLSFNSKVPRQLPVQDAIRQAVGGWVIDRRSNPTYYQVALNETSYDYIRNNRLYNADVLNTSSTINFPDGALELKGAWRILQDADTSRYHTMPAQVAVFDSTGQPTGQYRTATVGLVGLHIVYRAAGYPQWLWASFEQVDNAPDAASTAGNWSYYDPACSGPYCAPNVSPLRAGIPFGVPNRITRVSPIRPQIAAANAAWQPKMGSTRFRFYRLIGPQWPSDPNDPGNPQGTPTPGTLANVVLESYIQPTSSCMDCHSTARVPNNSIKTNYSFLFLFAQSPSAASR